jgi:hypothetical protein
MNLAKFNELSENGLLLKTQEPYGRGQLKDDRNYESKSEEPSAPGFDSHKKIDEVKWYRQDEISHLVAKTSDWIYTEKGGIVVNKVLMKCEEAQGWMRNQMKEGNFGWKEGVRDLATERGYFTNPDREIVYKVQTGETYGYKEFVEMLERQTALVEGQVSEQERQPQLKISPRDEKRKKTTKPSRSEKKIKSKRTRYIDYVESERENEDESDDDDNNEVKVVGQRKPLVVYSKNISYKEGDTHDSLELNSSGCGVIAEVVAKLEKEEPFRLLFGK